MKKDYRSDPLESIELAEEILAKLTVDNPEWACPLLGEFCDPHCWCYEQPHVREMYKVKGGTAYVVYGAYCSNAMFSGERS